MAQTLTPQIHLKEGIGGVFKTKRAHFKLANSAAETTYTLTAALANMAVIHRWSFSDQTAAAAVKAVPTATADGFGYTQLALTFTSGDTIDIFVEGE